ncbi:MAG: phosphoribosylglycinamide formyltransferase [Jaaginema sp. PMC 1079.18]|nr:phosphoribosylglycinamide formyltransferase [Jaaginema sp. PMC 1080.18]MEC4851661.1 phosphoribosylglycinamide formyltransferase [Jaaginema sp. PMC 1079.18]MEC4867331.1 phosphoribosylglycinamide formyltransferase [Jaaginema sp. PMC 1078.18]
MMSFTFISPDVSFADLKLPQPIRLGILASGSGSNFEAIAQAISDGKLNATIAIVIYNNHYATVVERARRWGVKAILLDHRVYQRREDLDRAIVATLKQHQVDWVIMAGWMRIVTAVLLETYRDRVLNIHPSLLPSFPGIRAVEQALAAQVKVTGCTVHFAHLAVDSGPMVMQAVVPVLEGDTAETLHQRIQTQEHYIFPLAIALAAFNQSRNANHP